MGNMNKNVWIVLLKFYSKTQTLTEQHHCIVGF